MMRYASIKNARGNKMVDIEARKAALDLLNQVDNKSLTNWQLEDKWPQSESDSALNCIMRWLWTLYDDDGEISLSNILVGENRDVFNRCRNFLNTDIEFRTKELSDKERRKIQKQYGKEWQYDCTMPANDDWPFPDKPA